MSKISLENLHKLLLKFEIPVAYDHFTTEQKPPFLAYRALSEKFNTADSKTVFRTANIELCYCSDLRNVAFERQIELLLEENGLTFDKSFLYLEKQEMYQITYNFTILEE
jgi:hypothetical protein